VLRGEEGSSEALLDLVGVRGAVESGSLAYHHWEEHTQVYVQKGWVHDWSPPLITRPAQASLSVANMAGLEP
jgi:hypothetical protein